MPSERKHQLILPALAVAGIACQIASAPAASAAEWTASSSNLPVVRVEAPAGTTMQFAAGEITRYLGMILGHSLPEAESANAPRIVLTKEAGAELGEEGYRITAEGRTLTICGGGDAGVVYGSYYFLRAVGGCRFSGLGPDCEYVPRRDGIVFSGQPIEMKPRLWYRGIQLWYAEQKEMVIHWLDWMAKNGLNYVMYTPVPDQDKTAAPYDPETGKLLKPGYPANAWFDKFIAPEVIKRGLKLDRNHHGLFSWLPPDEYYKEHPEYYSLVEGKRVAEAKQLAICTSNEKAVSTLIENMKRYLRSHPAVKIIGCIPEDGFGMCQCERCLAPDAEVSKETLTASDQISSATLKVLPINRAKTRRYATLVNKAARAIRTEFPDVLVGSAAYVDLVWPDPKEKPESNVVTWVAIYWRDGVQVLSANSPSARNRAYVEALARWRKAHQGRVILYEYYMGMVIQKSLPYPQDRVIVRDWPAMRSMGIEGATIQCWPSVANAYGLDQLAFARCGWEERVDPDTLQAEFLEGMYGAAAGEVKPIFDAFHETWRREEQNEAEMLPNGRSILPIMKVLGEGGLGRAIARARETASNDRETRQIDTLVLQAEYWKSAARVYQVKDQLTAANEKNDKQAAEELRPKLEKQVADTLRCFDRLPDGYVERTARRYWNQELPTKN
jgi:hypothetical protein